jgi:predicted NBD/HSP70 family sugar kinase
MKKNSTVAIRGKGIFKGKQLTIGMDLGDRFTYYCVLDEAGAVLIEQKLPTTKAAMQEVFGRMPRSRVALETGAHSEGVPLVVEGQSGRLIHLTPLSPSKVE